MVLLLRTNLIFDLINSQLSQILIHDWATQVLLMYIIASVWSNYSNTIRGVKGKSDFLGYLWKKTLRVFQILKLMHC